MLKWDEAGRSSLLRHEEEAWRTGGEKGAKFVDARAVVRLCGDFWRLGEDSDDRLELETQGETGIVGERAGEDCSVEMKE